ncbi:MAG: cytidylyltransferase domain-containing protein [Candidatus Muiribacteriota bacterium]
MNKTGIIIQARMSSKRLPNKAMADICNYPMIYHVINRCKKSELPVVVATSNQKSDDGLAFYLSKIKQRFFRGDLNNVLKRIVFCAKEFDFDRIIRVTGDNPFIDFENIKKLIKKDDYDYGYIKGGALGTGAEIVKISCLFKNLKTNVEPFDGEHVTLYIRRNLKKYNYFSVIGEKKLKNLRLTVDEKKDLEMTRKVYDKLFKENHVFTNNELIELFNKNPEIFSINKNVKQKKNL